MRNNYWPISSQVERMTTILHLSAICRPSYKTLKFPCGIIILSPSSNSTWILMRHSCCHCQRIDFVELIPGHGSPVQKWSICMLVRICMGEREHFSVGGMVHGFQQNQSKSPSKGEHFFHQQTSIRSAFKLDCHGWELIQAIVAGPGFKGTLTSANDPHPMYSWFHLYWDTGWNYNFMICQAVMKEAVLLLAWNSLILVSACKVITSQCNFWNGFIHNYSESQSSDKL